MGTDWTRVERKPRNPLTIDELDFQPPKYTEPGAWFLGPNGENLEQMRFLMVETLNAHAKARYDFWEEDPPFISEDVRKSDAFTQTFETMHANLMNLSNALRSSTPMASYRNKSHMNWDITMPGALGYFAGMLFNANNVATEASPVTTLLELDAGQDLCRMLGYGGLGAPKPWGHITCDGSIANAEAMWCARNLRYQGAALARAIQLEDDLKPARELSVKTAKGNFLRLLDLEPWELVNLPNDVILDLPRQLVEDVGVSKSSVRSALDTYGLQAMGMVDFHANVLMGLKPGCVAVPGTAHYSWDKGVALLGLGAKALRHIAVDLDARSMIPDLRRILDECIASQTPVLQVVAVAGTTAESAVDPINKIAELREEYMSKGLTFTLHVDAAWGGYFASMLRAPKGKDRYTPVEHFSDYVETQLRALRLADTITLDPHKSGYIPYPAGGLCYRDERMINLVAHQAPVVFHGDDTPSVGVYGIEGSKPGAAAAGVALSHKTIPLDQSGYGTLLGHCIFNAKRFYIGVNTLNKKDDPFFAIPVQRLPAERDENTNRTPKDERDLLRTLRNIPNEALLAKLDQDTDLKELFRKIGPDLTVFAYAFNFLEEEGAPNTELTEMNKLNEAIFKALSVEHITIEDQPPQVPMLVTSTMIAPESYGEMFVQNFCDRAKIERPDGALRVLISTMQDPWVSDTSTGNFIPTLMEILRDTVLTAREKIINERA